LEQGLLGFETQHKRLPPALRVLRKKWPGTPCEVPSPVFSGEPTLPLFLFVRQEEVRHGF
jgi:hypothetical protein